MDCNGKVLEVNDKIAKVLMRQEACGECNACHIGSMAKREEVIVDASNDVHAKVDDLVHLEVSGKKMMEASAIIFMIPLAGFFAGFLIGYYPLWFWINSTRDLLSIGCGFLLMALSYILVRYLGAKTSFEFVIKEVAGPDDLADDKPGDETRGVFDQPRSISD